MGMVHLHAEKPGSIAVLNVRLATVDDREEVITLVRGLLIELGGSPAPAGNCTAYTILWSREGQGS